MKKIDIRAIDIGMLRVVEALLLEKSVSRAADRLFLSQPAVSLALRKLRDIFDDPLFVRSGHGVEPTERALSLQPYVQEILAQVALLADVGSEFDPARSTRVFRIIGGEFLSYKALPLVMKKMSELQSGIKIFWDFSGAYSGAEDSLRRGMADIALLPRMFEPIDVVSEKIYEDQFVVVGRKGLFSGNISLEEYCSFRHVFLGYGDAYLDQKIDSILEGKGAERTLQVALTSVAQIIKVVAQTDFLSVIPSVVAYQFQDEISISQLPFKMESYGLYVCRGNRYVNDKGIDWMVEQLRDAII